MNSPLDILVIGPHPRLFGPGNFRWLHDTARALRRLGHRVNIFPYRESWSMSPRLSQWTRWLPGVPQQITRYQAAQRRSRAQRLVRLTKRLRPDLVVWLNGESDAAETFAAVKRSTPGRMVSWWEDDPECHRAFMAALPEFDHIFVFDRSYIPSLASGGARAVHFLPCGCDETTYHPYQLSRLDRRRFSCDVAFVGWYYPERGPVLQALTSLDLGVWGGQWNSPQACRALGRRTVIRGGGIDGSTAAKIYSACKIGLNVHATQSRLGGLNMRAFELLACGAFQLVDYIEGMEDLLQPDQEVVCYRSPDEARRLAGAYLADPQARQRIASRGRARVLDEHTFVHRLRTLCDLARD